MQQEVSRLLCLLARDVILWKQPQSRYWEVRVLVLALALTSCMTLKKAPYFSELRLLSCEMEGARGFHDLHSPV